MAMIEIKELTKRYGGVIAVDNVNLDINKGELVTLLGPSGCGKTTTLRCIAGLEVPEEGEIRIDGEIVTSVKNGIFVPPSKRKIGMVFQNYAVWPHMKVFDNIAYGLKLQKLPKDEIKRRVKEVLELVGLEGLEDRYPTQLSGGQQQRVALARALVIQPRVLLLDEPLSNLDAKLRERMRFEIRSLVKKTGITAVYVTHDQAEAIVISDRIVIMNKGKIMQIGQPEEVYKNPANTFVADFIGISNFIPGKLVAIINGTRGIVETDFGQHVHCLVSTRLKKDDKTFVLVRPENIQIFKDNPPPENSFKVRIKYRVYLGSIIYYWVTLGDTEIRVQAPPEAGYKEGEEVYIHFNPEKAVALPE